MNCIFAYVINRLLRMNWSQNRLNYLQINWSARKKFKCIVEQQSPSQAAMQELRNCVRQICVFYVINCTQTCIVESEAVSTLNVMLEHWHIIYIWRKSFMELAHSLSEGTSKLFGPTVRDYLRQNVIAVQAVRGRQRQNAAMTSSLRSRISRS